MLNEYQSRRKIIIESNRPQMTYCLKLRICYAVLDLNSYNLWRERRKKLSGLLVIDLKDLNFTGLSKTGYSKVLCLKLISNNWTFT